MNGSEESLPPGGAPAAPTIEIAGKEHRVRKWPIRKGLNFAGELSAVLGPVLAKLDAANVAALAAELAALLRDRDTSDLAVEMIVAALEGPVEERRALAEEAGLEDLVTVLERNVVFLAGRLAALRNKSAKSTTPAQPSPDSASPSSRPSTSCPETTPSSSSPLPAGANGAS